MAMTAETISNFWIGECICHDTIVKYYSWTWAHKDDKKVWDKFEKHVAPKVNHRLSRYQLHRTPVNVLMIS